VTSTQINALGDEIGERKSSRHQKKITTMPSPSLAVLTALVSE